MTFSYRVDFHSAVEQIDVLCRKVGLAPGLSLPRSSLGISVPEEIALWSSTYAHLLLWPVEDTSPQSIERCANDAEGWFDEFLSKVEATKRGRPVDGYLVLALPCEPGTEARDEVRRLELSSRICRKHLIWPADTAENGAADTWCRVADVTVLGLPDASMAGASELHWPEFDAEAAALWADLQQFGAPVTAKRDDAE